MEPQIHDAATSEARQRRLAAGLRSAGVGTGDRVVVAVPGSPLMVDLVLAACRSGVVPVPLDTRLTSSEREAIVSDVRPALVLDDDAGLTALDGTAEVDLDPWPRCRPMHFTSGTTGRPKGVWSGLLDGPAAAAAGLEERDLWGFSDQDVNLVVSPLHHSAPLRFATGTLLAGGSVAVLPRFEPGAMVAAVSAVRPTTMFCVPAHLQRLFAHEDATGTRLDPSSFRLVAHAGAPCPDAIRRRAHETFGRQTVWEFYGSTEGQFTACSAAEWHARPGTLGRPRPGRTITVDDDGLLWCAVPPWARFTYWEDREKTAAAWRDTPDGPAFTVGDLGRVEDGYVYLDARRTDLVISGGVNVYPAEVEAVLETVPGVVEIAVFGRPDDRWGQRVCAVWVGDADEQQLRQAAEEHLAPAKRPKEYGQVPALPRTATGKVRRTDLA
ncbi:AMP-binding enzyme [Aeromicrobium marinum DSM 15272]|uniref:AMP-binding enzyme n=1 Tax=Aeromicrobium marinum DSM 15272 TaxID=585531 RepID=E2SAD7_9ACTN|nr:AMP-binding protein [Aeromicrobium marinum]EFQ84211.1 AMP-binding enzyme [Aeromicrobium marinum DSM 15272]